VSAEQLPGTGGLEVVVAGRRHVVPPARRFVVGRGAGVDLDPLVEFVDVGGNAFEADGLTVTTPKGKTLLHSVGFALPGKTLMAVIGPSGAGKSTLLGALIGSRPADRGTVRYAGRDLLPRLRRTTPPDRAGAAGRRAQLTVRQALSYAARLRFPADTDADARRRRWRRCWPSSA
jgi:ATPase subunit of ABC transporter with duplicated ATPase domains